MKRNEDCPKCGGYKDYRAKQCSKCYTKSLSGSRNPNYKGGLPHCTICGKTVSRRECTNCSKHNGACLGKFGRNHPRFGIKPKYYRDKYKNTLMRSSYEIKFAYFLDCSNIKWNYELRTFDLGDTTYTPDFYLPEFDCYIEIKGWFPLKDQKRVNLFKKCYPKVNFELLKQKELINMGVL